MAFSQYELAVPPGPLRDNLILFITMFLHGLLLLHFRVTASFEEELPHMLLYVTSLICTFEVTYTKRNNRFIIFRLGINVFDYEV